MVVSLFADLQVLVDQHPAAAPGASLAEGAQGQEVRHEVAGAPGAAENFTHVYVLLCLTRLARPMRPRVRLLRQESCACAAWRKDAKVSRKAHRRHACTESFQNKVR